MKRILNKLVEEGANEIDKSKRDLTLDEIREIAESEGLKLDSKVYKIITKVFYIGVSVGYRQCKADKKPITKKKITVKDIEEKADLNSFD